MTNEGRSDAKGGRLEWRRKVGSISSWAELNVGRTGRRSVRWLSVSRHGALGRLRRWRSVGLDVG